MQWHVKIMAAHQMMGMGLVKRKLFKLLYNDLPLNVNGHSANVFFMACINVLTFLEILTYYTRILISVFFKRVSPALWHTYITLPCYFDFVPAGHSTKKQSLSLQDEQLMTLHGPVAT